MKDFLLNTLTQKYDHEIFTKFALEFFNDLEINKKEIEINNTFENHIQDFKLIGQYQDPENKKIHVLEVKLKDTSKLENARTTQRNIIAKHIKDYWLDGALVAFYSEKSSSWRLSFVKIEYKFDKNGKTKEELTPPKRYSFLVGEAEPTHTANQQLLPLIEEIKYNPTLAQIEDAFSVEKVTKEFFEEYRKLYEMLVKELNGNHTFQNEAQTNNINTENFAKKLLGQIVFLYFLQKKGWIGAPKDKSLKEGNKNFLSDLFKECVSNNKNFFNDHLEYLFYDALNKKSDKPGTFYRERFNCQIPFLNGGLFEPEYNWKNSYIYLDNKIFKQVLNIFDRYNFTVREDEPLEKEVAVDPEMLGKVFENLLTENLRKGKGTYYTPREIVHYMCQESLINYLITESNIDERKIRKLVSQDFIIDPDKDLKTEIDSKGIVFSDKEVDSLEKILKNIKVCDPACGSGAFLIGMLQLVVHSRDRLTAYLKMFDKSTSNRSEYDLKKETIQNCIYGVDIDPGAVEIAKLRLWLSLIVEYELEDIEPLPNLDYKIMQGNSLLEELVLGDTTIPLYPHNNSKDNPKMKNLLEKEMQTDLFGEANKNKQIIEKLTQLQKEYFTKNDLEEKKKIKAEIEQIEMGLIKENVQKEIEKLEDQNKNIGKYLAPGTGLNQKDAQKFSKILTQKAQIVNTLEEIKNTGIKPFFLWHLYFADVFEKKGGKGGFDIVIANPPYVKEYVNKNAFDGLRNSPYYQGKMDLWYMFACQSIDLVRNRGAVTFIAQNNWVTSYGASKMRDKVIQDAQILALIDFRDFKIFETAGIQTMVMMFKKDKSQDKYNFDYRRIISSRPVLDDIIDLLNKSNNQNCQYLNPSINRKKLSGKNFVFSDSEVETVLNRIAHTGNFKLDPIKEVAQGIVCPQDYLNKAGQNKIGSKYKIGTGIFIIKDIELDAMNLSKKELSLIKPFYTTKELHKWNGLFDNKKWIIYTDSSFKDGEKIKEYPKIKEYLDRFKKVITSDNGPYGLHRARDEYFFKGEKIIVARKCLEPAFTYTDFDSYVSATFYVIKAKRMDQKYLIGLLNSELVAFWLKHKGKMQGNNYQIDKEPILDIPLINAKDQEQKKIRKIVDKILAITKSSDYLENSAKQSQVHDYEKQIDQMVYKLYGLTESEIKIVKGDRNE